MSKTASALDKLKADLEFLLDKLAEIQFDMNHGMLENVLRMKIDALRSRLDQMHADLMT